MGECNFKHKCPICGHFSLLSHHFEDKCPPFEFPYEEYNYKCDCCGYEYNEVDDLIGICIKDIATVYNHVPYNNKYENIEIKYFFYFNNTLRKNELKAMLLLSKLKYSLDAMVKNKRSTSLTVSKQNLNTMQALKYARKQKDDLKLLAENIHKKNTSEEYTSLQSEKPVDLESQNEIYDLAQILQIVEITFQTIKAKDVVIDATATIAQIIYNNVVYEVKSPKARELWEKASEEDSWIVYKNIFGTRKDAGDTLNVGVVYIPALNEE